MVSQLVRLILQLFIFDLVDIVLLLESLNLLGLDPLDTFILVKLLFQSLVGMRQVRHFFLLRRFDVEKTLLELVVRLS
jgi:hypothetical protein